MADVPLSYSSVAAWSSALTNEHPLALLLGAPPGDTTDPVVDNFAPPNGSEILGTDPIYFDVTDNSGLFARVFVVALQNHGTDDDPEWITELVHDGDDFASPYANLSTRSNIADGFRYKVRRDGGWLSAVTITVHAIDRQANEA